MTTNRLGIEFLSEIDLERIEETAYRLLDEVGILLEHEDAVDMLDGIGCRIDGARVKIPLPVVESALKNLRPHRQVYNHDGSVAFQFGDGKLRFHNGGGPPFIYDLENSKRREATLSDVADISRLLDYLPHVDLVTPLFGPQDVPDEMLAVASTHAMLINTNKPISSAAIEKAEHVSYIVEMAAACSGGIEAFKEHPFLSISVSPISPLHFSRDVTAAIIAVVESGTPFHSLPAPSLGGTAPITIAAALAQQHAEVLASFVIAAAAQPGALVSYCSRINPIDMRTAISNWGGPEVGMSGACAAQLAHRLGMACDSYGFSSSVSTVDAQFTYERFSNAFIPALAGVDILSGVGSAESGMVGAHEIAVLDNELIGMMKHIIEGVSVNEETLAYELMKDVIENDQMFLSEKHTINHMRLGAVWMSKIVNRGQAQNGESSEDILAIAKAQAREILNTHKPDPLPETVQAELDDVLDRASRKLIHK
ncbi:MAG: trimethylamine methyltransferase family protein [Anaerolineales bacterium]|jgi:trimethylamine--corrinoid protein Co-methyltransferase